MTLPADPWFYAVAVPAVLLMGLSKSGFAPGFGALAVPLMALAMPVPQAAAVMLPLLAVMDMVGLASLWRERDRAQVRLLLPAALLGTVLGTLVFARLSAPVVAALVGALTLAFLAVRRLRPPRPDAAAAPRWLARALATTGGFTSFVAHAGGPPVAFAVLPLRLPPATVTATLAVVFAALNTSKWLPYAWLGLIDRQALTASLVLMPLAPMGVWLGVRWVRHVPARLFYGLFEVGMLLTGVKLLADGWRAASG